mmetsp:Transcript_22959/g.64502  ORF Transcript_22959/g.64502 Transcript_22959/m.64502 type:complete len:99 (+) Transcript_22959:1-297(+)
MPWYGGFFAYPVVVGSSGWESFQLLVESAWEKAVYPSTKDASQFERDWAICGPDGRGHGKNWKVGKAGVEKVWPGLRFSVVVTADAHGRFTSVRWRPL